MNLRRKRLLLSSPEYLYCLPVYLTAAKSSPGSHIPATGNPLAPDAFFQVISFHNSIQVRKAELAEEMLRTKEALERITDVHNAE